MGEVIVRSAVAAEEGEAPQQQDTKEAMGKLREGVEEKKVRMISDALIKHFNAAFESDQLIADAKASGGEETLRTQRDEIYNAVFADLKGSGIDFGKPPDSLQKLKKYLRDNNHLFMDGDLIINDPNREGTAYRVMMPTLHAVRRREKDALKKYLPDKLKFGEGALVEVLYVGGNEIRGGEETLKKNYKLTARMLGTFERTTGGAAIIFEDAILAAARDQQKQRDGVFDQKKVDALIQEMTQNTKLNEVFHAIFQGVFEKHIGTPRFERARFPFQGKRYAAGEVNEAFSSLGTLLYGKGNFLQRLNTEIVNDSSATYAFTQAIFRAVAEKVAPEVGGAISKEGKITIPSGKEGAFEALYREMIANEVVGLMMNLKRGLDAGPKK